MKIPLTIRSYANGPKPFAEIHISNTPREGRRSFGVISAFVDTGSADTFISMTDALRLNIKPVGEGRRVLIGGYAVKLHEIKVS